MIDNEYRDYIAQILSTEAAMNQGYSCGPRWWCLRQDLKDAHRLEADRVVKEWARKERETAADADAEGSG